MQKLIYTIVSYNGTGGHTISSGQFDIQSKSDLNRAIRLLERTKGSGQLDLDLLGPFNKDITLPTRYARIGL
ncbi:hypothetical protein [Citrobacter phage Ci1]|nr:hypothetical protein [Citrobacter phage Ci1]